MRFYEVVNQVIALLQREGRVSYRALRREFNLDDEYIEDLKEEIIGAKQLAVDDSGRFLVWTSKPTTASVTSNPPQKPQSPASYTPQHLAERILAEQAAMEFRGSADGERKTITALFADLFEDLHWIDTETQGFLDTLSESVASAKVLLLVNYRPEYRHEWGQKTYYSQLQLAPLGKEEAEELLTFLLGNDASLKALKVLILERTEGTPFFMEEVVQTLAEEGALSGERGHYRLDTTPTELHISPTVQGVLAARIDRLSTDEKQLLQQLAVIGRQFPAGLVRQVVSQSEGDLYRLLSSLQAKDYLYEQPAFPEVEFFFKHALTQEVAYGTVLQERRKALHEITAQAIETLYSASLGDHYGELAYHYQRSGNAEKAVEYLQLAGQQAAQRSAYTEAITHLTRALELLKFRPDTPGRVQHEFAVQITLGPVFMATKGWAAVETGAAYSRAHELSQQIEETPQLFPVRYGLWLFYSSRGEWKGSLKLAEDLLSLAQRTQNTVLLVEAHFALGMTFFYLGEFTQAHKHLKQGSTLFEPQPHSFVTFMFGFDPGMGCLGFAAWTLWHLGYPDQALSKLHRVLTHKPPSLFDQVIAQDYACRLHQYRREGAATQERAETEMALSAEQGFPFYLALGTIFRGWALAGQGQVEEGVAQVRQGLQAFLAMGAEGLVPGHLALLAEVQGKAGKVEEGLNAIAEALTLVYKKGERFYEAELYRLKGELLLQKVVGSGQKADPNPQSPGLNFQAEAEECFHKAIEIARQQEAKSLELRTATSLARLWQRQGKKAEARELLSPVYNWFTEGFDTADLQEAKELLDKLG